jgi:hypothetical protein
MVVPFTGSYADFDHLRTQDLPAAGRGVCAAQGLLAAGDPAHSPGGSVVPVSRHLTGREADGVPVPAGRLLLLICGWRTRTRASRCAS